MIVTTINADGSRSEREVTLDPETEQLLAKMRAYWAALREAGTPYWCIHKDRSVSHPSAYWQDDQLGEPIHRKHGVRCRDCGGYIQEG